MPDRLPVLRPQLPDADRLLPYLRRIDASRTYSNWGPLAVEFEQRFAGQLHMPGIQVVSAASGTLALVGAILATAGRAPANRPLAIVPAFTFVATAVAVELTGFRPYAVDVHPLTWRIDLSALTIGSVLDQVGVVVVVAPFGRPVPLADLLQFQGRTGIPVVVDGGASLEGIERVPEAHLGPIPTALSLHATKSLSAAEGGCVLTSDLDLAVRVTQALNFGFHGTRLSAGPSVNGKMSEFHAAIGLAELDSWPEKRRHLGSVAHRYRERMRLSGIPGTFFGLPDVAGCYALWLAETAEQSVLVRRALHDAGIETRLWYGLGLLEHPHFASIPHDRLDVTAALAPRLVGLPIAVDLTDATIERIVDVIGHAL